MMTKNILIFRSTSLFLFCQFLQNETKGTQDIVSYNFSTILLLMKNVVKTERLPYYNGMSVENIIIYVYSLLLLKQNKNNNNE